MPPIKSTSEFYGFPVPARGWTLDFLALFLATSTASACATKGPPGLLQVSGKLNRREIHSLAFELMEVLEKARVCGEGRVGCGCIVGEELAKPGKYLRGSVFLMHAYTAQTTPASETRRKALPSSMPEGVKFPSAWSLPVRLF